MTPLEIALERIEECRRTRAPELDLSGLGLDEIPEQVFELTWLLTIECRNNKISDLSALAHVPNLETLYCGHNKISDLSFLAHAPNLQTLDCSYNKISDLSALAHVPNLQTLRNCPEITSRNQGD